MRAKEAVRLAGQIADLTRGVLDQNRLKRARELLQERMAGGVSTGIGGVNRVKGSHPDPTGNNATAIAMGKRRDKAREDLLTVDGALRNALKELAMLAAIVEAELNVVTDPDSKGNLGCRACEAVDPETWVPRYSGELCKWHVDFVADYGVEPHRDLVEHHLAHPGSKRPIAVIRDLHPDEYKQRHTAAKRVAPMFAVENLALEDQTDVR